MKPATILYWFPLDRSRPGIGWGDGWKTAIPENWLAKFARNTRVTNTSGPDPSRRGVLISTEENVLVTYDPQSQTWRKIGPCWIGIRSDYTSESLAKTDHTGAMPAGGYPVTLGDGRTYIIPVALADTPHYQIPWRETLDTAGRIIRDVDPRYESLCRAAAILWDHVSTDAQFSMPEDDLRIACATAISVNYRLDLTECLALGLFTSESYQAIVAAILDVPGMEDLLKKKRPDTPDTACGVMDVSETTIPPTPTSP